MACNDMMSAIQAAYPTMSVAGQEMFTNLVAGLIAGQETFSTSVVTIIDGAIIAVDATYLKWYNSGSFLAEGLIAGLNSKLDAVKTAAAALADEAADALAQAAKIKSPSKVTTRLGGFFGMGWVNGITNQIKPAEDIADEMAHRTAFALNKAQNLISRVLEDDFTPVIAPVLDLSNVEKGASLISAMTGGRIVDSIEATNSLPGSFAGSNSVSNVGPTYNIVIDGIKYNTDDYVDTSIQNFVETMVRKNKMYAGR